MIRMADHASALLIFDWPAFAVGKNDRRFAKPRPATPQQPQHFFLKRVPARPDFVERQLFELRYAITAIAAADVFRFEPQQPAGVEIYGPAHQFTLQTASLQSRRQEHNASRS